MRSRLGGKSDTERTEVSSNYVISGMERLPCRDLDTAATPLVDSRIEFCAARPTFRNSCTLEGCMAHVKDGIFISGEGGSCILAPGTYAFVRLLRDDFIRINPASLSEWGEAHGHDQLTASGVEQLALFAGEVTIDETMTVIKWNNKSGTYAPEAELGAQSLLPLACGYEFCVDDGSFELMCPPGFLPRTVRHMMQRMKRLRWGKQ